MSSECRKMRWAMSPYSNQLVDADNELLVGGCQSIFRCPVCNCDVFYRKASHNKAASFVHKKDTDETPYCSQRTNGFNKSYNKRIITTPFPIYLLHNENHYHLHVRFRPIPKKFTNLENSRVYNNSLEINFKISEIIKGFYNQRVSKPPTRENNYIHIEKSKENLDLLNDWGNSIDFFERHGSFFDYSTGKKIPSGVPIYCGKDYLLIMMTHNLLVDPTIEKLYNSIFIEKMGNLKTIETSYEVIHVILPDEISDPLIRFCSKFGYSVSEQSSEPTLMWPPAIEKNGTFNTLWSGTKNYITINNADAIDLWLIDERIRDMHNSEYTRHSKTLLSINPNSSKYTLMFSNNDGSDSIMIEEGTAEDYIENNIEEKYQHIIEIDSSSSTVGQEKLLSNFIQRCIVVNAEGKVQQFIGKSTIIPTDYEYFILYNYHFKLCDTIQKPKNQNLSKMSIRDAVYDRMICVEPFWLKSAIIEYSKTDPVNARIAFRSINSGKAPLKLVKIFQEISQ